MRQILVTGSSGHLGEAIVRTLQARNIKYAGIDTKASDFTTHIGSITDATFVEEMMRDVDAVIHTATLHKPHVMTHSDQDFVNTNISGTLTLLREAAKNQGINSFIYTSTTSTFGDSLIPNEGEPAAWITEDTVPVPKNIYGVTKSAAEDLCQLYHRDHGMACLVLKTSRFFPEQDDKKEVRELYRGSNAKANEYLYRRVDIEDAVSAHLLAAEKAPEIGFGKYIISATSPFSENDLADLRHDAPRIVRSLFPDYEKIYQSVGWKMFSKIDRVYVNRKARADLRWQPKYDFRHVLDAIASERDFRSQLAKTVGTKGYHSQTFEDGLYPVKK